MTHLEQLYRCGRRPAHLLLDDPQQLADFVVLIGEDLPLTQQCLSRAIKPFEDYHDWWIVRVGVELNSS